MTDAISPTEIRWSLISFFGLVLLTSLVTSMGMADEAYNPSEPEIDGSVQNESELRDGEKTFTQSLNDAITVSDSAGGIESEITSIDSSTEEVTLNVNPGDGVQRSHTYTSVNETYTFTWYFGEMDVTLVSVDGDTAELAYETEDFKLFNPNDSFGILDNTTSMLSNVLGFIIGMFEAWEIVASNAGFASVFIFGPMVVMSIILLNTLFKFISLIVNAIPL